MNRDAIYNIHKHNLIRKIFLNKNKVDYHFETISNYEGIDRTQMIIKNITFKFNKNKQTYHYYPDDKK
jgi:hypothetical protein